MAKEKEKIEEIEKIDSTDQKELNEQSEAEVPKAKSSFNIKIVLFGLPIFILQLVAVYFITANFITGGTRNEIEMKDGVKTENTKERSPLFDGGGELGKYILPIDDIIVNPSGTDGKRLLLVSLGFDVADEENKNELKNKEVLLRDVVISTLSSKTLLQLDDVSYKDSLKYEIASKLKQKIPSIKLNDVYFSKYIIQ
jgi:flagellar FliL protein